MTLLNNKNAIIAADEYCSNTGKTLLLGDYNDILHFDTKISLSGRYSVISRGTLKNETIDDTRDYAFITVGSSGSTTPLLNTYFEFNRITCKELTGHPTSEMSGYTGLLFLNIQRSSIVFNGEGIVKFNIAMCCKGMLGGFIFNRVYLPICYGCKTSIQILSDGSSGFCNSNLFYGGGAYNISDGFGIDLVGGTGGINCNAFYGFAFEMSGTNNIPVKASGSVGYNVFRDFRNEDIHNSTRTFFFAASTEQDVRHNHFYCLFNNPGISYPCDKINAANGTFNVYRSLINQALENFKGRLELTTFTPPAIIGAKMSIPGLDAFKLIGTVMTPIDGFTTSEATVTDFYFSLLNSSYFFGKRIKLNNNPYVLIQSNIEEVLYTKTVYIIPYNGGNEVTHTFSLVSGEVTSAFVKSLGNTITPLGSVNSTLMSVQGNYESDFLIWFNIPLIDEVLVLFSQGLSSSSASPVTWTKVAVAVGNNNDKVITQEVANTSDNIICTFTSVGGHLTLPARKVGKGFIFIGNVNDTFNLGTTASGTDILNAQPFDSTGKFIFQNLFFYLLDQVFYISGNNHPLTVILAV